MSGHSSIHTATTHTKSFREKFKQNLSHELLNAKNIFFFIIVSFIAIIMFVFEFPIVKIVVGLLLPFFVLYFGGKYLTLLPMYIVFILMLMPKKFSLPFLGLSIFLSVFMVFLI